MGEVDGFGEVARHPALLRALAHVLEDFRDTRAHHGGTQGDGHCANGVPMRQMQASMIRQAMEQAAGNVSDAARALGISRATLYRKLARKDA